MKKFFLLAFTVVAFTCTHHLFAVCETGPTFGDFHVKAKVLRATGELAAAVGKEFEAVQVPGAYSNQYVVDILGHSFTLYIPLDSLCQEPSWITDINNYNEGCSTYPNPPKYSCTYFQLGAPVCPRRGSRKMTFYPTWKVPLPGCAGMPLVIQWSW